MISLVYTEKVVNATSTVLLDRPCQVKKLRLVYASTGPFGGPGRVLFRDGGATGKVMGRLYVVAGSRARYADEIECKKNEILDFKTNVFVEVVESCVVGIYTMGNPVGTQGS